MDGFITFNDEPSVLGLYDPKNGVIHLFNDGIGGLAKNADNEKQAKKIYGGFVSEVVEYDEWDEDTLATIAISVASDLDPADLNPETAVGSHWWEAIEIAIGESGDPHWQEGWHAVAKRLKQSHNFSDDQCLTMFLERYEAEPKNAHNRDKLIDSLLWTGAVEHLTLLKMFQNGELPDFIKNDGDDLDSLYLVTRDRLELIESLRGYNYEWFDILDMYLSGELPEFIESEFDAKFLLHQVQAYYGTKK